MSPYQEFKTKAYRYAELKHGVKKSARYFIAREMKELEWIWRKDPKEFETIIKGE